MTGGAAEKMLRGLRILVVEDEAAISLLIEDMLLALGCTVVGPVAHVADALALIETAQIDEAILDVNVAGEPVWPVAAALAARGVPFVFATGYGEAGLRQRYRDSLILEKPFRGPELKRAIIGSLRGRGTR